MTNEKQKEIREGFKKKFGESEADYNCVVGSESTDDIADYWLKVLDSELERQREESFKNGRIKELEILRAHLDRQVMERTVNTDSIYNYISSALSALTTAIKGVEEQ